MNQTGRDLAAPLAPFRVGHPKLMDRCGVAAVLVLILMLAEMPSARAEDLRSLCGGCQASIGIGGTFHYWAGTTGGLVVPLTVDWSGGRYELGVFRMATAQSLETSDLPRPHRVAGPFWGVSASRRFLFGPPAARFFIGLGGSYKSEHDRLDSTRWNFAEQLGVRFRVDSRGSAVELSVRHWSNAGLRRPNIGQDFVTLTYAF
jgi:hypothetical protein